MSHAIRIVFDAAVSARRKDENGYLHVSGSHITKAAVNPYYGREIPGWEEAGLDPLKIYYGFRAPEELQKSLPTWAGLPLHVEHHVDSADNPQKLTRVGSVGTDVVWNAPYVDAPLTVWDASAIAAIEDGTYRELSCAYRYTPDYSTGTHDGVPYDFIMRDIRGNHVALVEEGRAGPDVVVADANIHPHHSTGGNMEDQDLKNNVPGDGDPETERREVDLAQAIIDLHRTDPDTGKLVDVMEDEDKAKEIREIIGAMAGKMEPEELERLKNALSGLAYNKPEIDAAPFDDGMKEAMDKCGLDAENADFQRAFAEGVRYGERKEKEEPKKLDEEHEAEGMKKTMGKDSALRGGMGMDADAIRAAATRDTRRHMHELFSAVSAVRPLVGALEPMSFDSADDVYAHALKEKGYDPTRYHRESLRGMVDVLLRQREESLTCMARDAAKNNESLDGDFSGLNNIVLA